MLIKPPDDIPSSEITPEGVYRNRRAFIKAAGLTAAALAAGTLAPSLLAACSSDTEGRVADSAAGDVVQ
jgi:sulfoxide reductase catalytic subunit YedY